MQLLQLVPFGLSHLTIQKTLCTNFIMQNFSRINLPRQDNIAGYLRPVLGARRRAEPSSVVAVVQVDQSEKEKKNGRTEDDARGEDASGRRRPGARSDPLGSGPWCRSGALFRRSERPGKITRPGDGSVYFFALRACFRRFFACFFVQLEKVLSL